MGPYIVRKLILAFSILIGVNFITFFLFFNVNSVESIARSHLGEKYISTEQIENWLHQHEYDKPLFYNQKEAGWQKFSDTLFVKQSLQLFSFHFGLSDNGRAIGQEIKQRIWPSLALALPLFFISLLINVMTALFLILLQDSWLMKTISFILIGWMSISLLFFIILGQFIFAKVFQLVPISGYEAGLSAWRFLILPVFIGVLSGFGLGVRWYHSLFKEVSAQEFVRAARARGLSNTHILLKVVLRNGLLPVLTTVVVLIPSLFLGNLLLESFFGIPGLGSYMIDAVHQQDFAIVRAMVYLGTVFYIVGLILTDLTYLLADPRIRLESQ